MRAILIDPQARTVSEVDYTGDYKNIYEHIDAECFDCVRIGDEIEHTLFVDDEGLINGRADGTFRYDGDNPAYLVGKGLILATDADVESIEASLSLDYVRSKVAFGEPARIGGVLVFIEVAGNGTGTGRYWPIN